MKEKKTKNHKENWIGNIIRGFLLFMPLLAIGVTCAYVIFNKNAYQSYYGSNINEYKTEKPNQLISGQEYFLNINTQEIENNATIYINGKLSNFQASGYQQNTIETIVNDTSYFVYLNNGTSNMYLSFRDINGSTINNINVKTASVSFNFTFDYLTGNENSIIEYITYKIYNENSFISEVFYYSIDKVQQSPLFNWSTDTGMYNVIHSACNTLGIETTFIPFLLSYWLLTYLIYIIYDIALLIVNMAHNRIHDVESSI